MKVKWSSAVLLPGLSYQEDYFWGAKLCATKEAVSDGGNDIGEADLGNNARCAAREGFLFADDTVSHTKPTSWGKGWEDQGSNRFDPKYNNHDSLAPWPHSLFGWRLARGSAHTFSTKRFWSWVRYVSILKKKALKLLKEEGLTLLHHHAKVHTWKLTSGFLAKEKVKGHPRQLTWRHAYWECVCKNEADPDKTDLQCTMGKLKKRGQK